MPMGLVTRTGNNCIKAIDPHLMTFLSATSIYILSKHICKSKTHFCLLHVSSQGPVRPHPA